MTEGLEALKLYAEKHLRRKELEEECEKLKADCKGLLHTVLMYFQHNGVDRQTVEGYTLAPRYELWAGRNAELTAEDMHDALVEAGLKQFATESMNHQGMSAHIREVYKNLVAEEQEKSRGEQKDVDRERLENQLWSMYPSLEGKLEIREEIKISVTKSKKSTARGRIHDVIARSQQLEGLPDDDRID